MSHDHHGHQHGGNGGPWDHLMRVIGFGFTIFFLVLLLAYKLGFLK